VEEAEQRYSDEEVRRILKDASRSEDLRVDANEVVAPSSHSDGLTLDEIKQIAREALIDPAAVERAARDVRAPRSIRLPSRAASPLTRVVQGELLIPRRLTDREIRQVALEAERVLARRGHMRRSQDGAEWRDEEKRFSVRIIRGDTATRVAAAYDQSSELVGGSRFLAATGTAAMVVALTSFAAPMLLAAVPLVAGGTVGLMWLNAIGRSATTRETLSDLLEHIEQIVLLD
jgi:hypothetical protein